MTLSSSPTQKFDEKVNSMCEHSQAAIKAIDYSDTYKESEDSDSYLAKLAEIDNIKKVFLEDLAAATLALAKVDQDSCLHFLDALCNEAIEKDPKLEAAQFEYPDELMPLPSKLADYEDGELDELELKAKKTLELIASTRDKIHDCMMGH